MIRRFALSIPILTLALAPACAGGAGRRADTPVAEARLKDSAPERAASLRAAHPGLRLEEDEQRWGIAQARERERREAAFRARRMGTPRGAAGTGGSATPCEGPRC
jgi:hypothetical protein